MKTPINEQFIKMQKLAGVITESQYVTELRKLNENTDIQTAWDNVKDTDDFSKEDFIAGLTDDGDGKPFINMSVGTMPSDMQDAIEDYLKKNGMIEETPRPNAYNDSVENSNLDLYGNHPYDNDGIDVSNESKKPKMTKTELKEAIRQEILAALTEDNLTEAEDEEEEEIALDAETEETPADDTADDATGDTTDSQDVQKELTDALEAAKKLGDKKLVRQIGNALTYFTRQQISSEEV
jgi:hypothetical protein